MKNLGAAMGLAMLGGCTGSFVTNGDLEQVVNESAVLSPGHYTYWQRSDGPLADWQMTESGTRKESYYGYLSRAEDGLSLRTTFEAAEGPVAFFGPVAGHYVMQVTTSDPAARYSNFVIRIEPNGEILAADIGLNGLLGDSLRKQLSIPEDERAIGYIVMGLTDNPWINWPVIERMLREDGDELSHSYALRLAGIAIESALTTTSCTDQAAPVLYANVLYLPGAVQCTFDTIVPAGQRTYSIGAMCHGNGGTTEAAQLSASILDDGASVDGVFGSRMAALLQQSRITVPIELKRGCGDDDSAFVDFD